jgi:hypothetical protein
MQLVNNKEPATNPVAIRNPLRVMVLLLEIKRIRVGFNFQILSQDEPTLEYASLRPQKSQIFYTALAKDVRISPIAGGFILVKDVLSTGGSRAKENLQIYKIEESPTKLCPQYPPKFRPG